MWHDSDYSTGMSVALVEPHTASSTRYTVHDPTWGELRRDYITGARLRLTRDGKGDYLEVDLAAFHTRPAPVRRTGHPVPVAVIARCAREPEIDDVAVYFDAHAFYSGRRHDVDHATYPNLATALVALGFLHCV